MLMMAYTHTKKSQSVSSSKKEKKETRTNIMIPLRNILPRSLIPLLTPNHQLRLQRHSPHKHRCKSANPANVNCRTLIKAYTNPTQSMAATTKKWAYTTDIRFLASSPPSATISEAEDEHGHHAIPEVKLQTRFDWYRNERVAREFSLVVGWKAGLFTFCR